MKHKSVPSNFSFSVIYCFIFRFDYKKHSFDYYF